MENWRDVNTKKEYREIIAAYIGVKRERDAETERVKERQRRRERKRGKLL